MTKRGARCRNRRRLYALFSGLCFLFLAACGVQIGNSPYIGEHNVGPQSQQYKQQQVQQTGKQYRELVEGGYESTRGSTSVIELARRQIGVPYRFGGSEPKKGFDCSGLIFWVYKQNGVSLPRVAQAQSGHGEPVHKSMLKAGDIVAFRIKGVYHTGIYSGNGYFIHSPKRGDHVREESMETNYWQRHFIGGRRVI
jgi:cell wall-associated NlpC family hydrolase